jgi:hypothetical protein
MQPPRRPRLSDMTPAELQGRADELRRMAEQASPRDIQEALRRLAERYERLARDREPDSH